MGIASDSIGDAPIAGSAEQAQPRVKPPKPRLLVARSDSPTEPEAR